VIVHTHPDRDQHQNLTTSRGSPTAHGYHVWSTSVNAFVSYPAHRQNEWQNDRRNEREHNSASLDRVVKLI